MTLSTTDAVLWGYTMRDLETMTRAAVASARTAAADYTDRHDAAWHAIAERLVDAPQRPARDTLLQAGIRAVYQTVNDHLRHHGTPPGSDPGVVRLAFSHYWGRVTQPADSPETDVVERQALYRVWPCLTGYQQRALTALATHGTCAEAAAGLGVAYQTLDHHLRAGRRRFLELWHGDETPHLSAYSRNRHRTRKPHCPAGHELTDDNTRVYPRIIKGRRHTIRLCKTCEQARGAKRAMERTGEAS